MERPFVILAMFYVYVLKSENHDRFYVGMTQNIEQRIQQHNSGKTKSTKFYKPWHLVHKEKMATRIEARNREKYLKSGIGREFIRKTY